MSQKVIPHAGSLIERAAEIYDFKAAIKAPIVAPAALTPFVPSAVEGQSAPAEVSRLRPSQTAWAGPIVAVDRNRLRENGFIVPDSAPGGRPTQLDYPDAGRVAVGDDEARRLDSARDQVAPHRDRKSVV